MTVSSQIAKDVFKDGKQYLTNFRNTELAQLAQRDFLTKVFKLNEDSKTVMAIGYLVAVCSFITALFTRSWPLFNKYLQASYKRDLYNRIIRVNNDEGESIGLSADNEALKIAFINHFNPKNVDSEFAEFISSAQNFNDETKNSFQFGSLIKSLPFGVARTVISGSFLLMLSKDMSYYGSIPIAAFVSFMFFVHAIAAEYRYRKFSAIQLPNDKKEANNTNSISTITVNPKLVAGLAIFLGIMNILS